jgi:hypothetical protein
LFVRGSLRHRLILQFDQFDMGIGTEPLEVLGDAVTQVLLPNLADQDDPNTHLRSSTPN